MDLTETGWEGVDCIIVAQVRDRWRFLLNTVVNIRVPYSARHFSVTKANINFSSRTQLHGVVTRNAHKVLFRKS
jgi:hypothetical protein